MLDKPSDNAEPFPTRLRRLFDSLSGGDKPDSAAKNQPPKEPEERKHQFAVWYIFAAFLGVMLFQYLWLQYSQVESIPYSQFEQLLNDNKISEVLVGSDLHPRHACTEPLPDGRKLSQHHPCRS